MAFVLRIDLKDARPPIWRRLVVEGDTMLDEFHEMLQIAFEWDNQHLYHFETPDLLIKEPDEFENELMMKMDSTDPASISLKEVLQQPGNEMLYEYDFGDSWVHKIKFEKKMPLRDEDKPVLCIGGKKQAPPEDCGGLPGFYALLDVFKDPHHPEYQDMKAWLGYHFDPDDFSENRINELFEENF